MLPGSESKLLKGLKLGCSGIITATCNVTANLQEKFMMILKIIKSRLKMKSFVKLEGI